MDYGKKSQLQKWKIQRWTFLCQSVIKRRLNEKRRKEERQREAEYAAFVASVEATNANIPAAVVNHLSGGGGLGQKDIRLENFSISIGGRELISEASITLAFGRRYEGW